MALEEEEIVSHTHSMGSGFLDLPNELVIEILVNIPSDFAKTLWSISLVCKQLRSVVESFMEPKYNLRGGIMGDPFAFVRRVAKKPLLQSVIRSMSITPSFVSSLERTPEEVDTLIRSLDLQEFYESIPCMLGTKYNSPAFGLAFLPNLESLDIKSDPTIARYHPFYDSTTAHEQLSFFGDENFRPTELRTHAFRNLVHLNLLFLRKDNVVVCDGRMFQLPNLRKVCLSNVEFRASRLYVPVRSSPVTELHLLDLSSWQNNMPGLHLFHLFYGLERLHLNFRYWRDFRNFIPTRYLNILYAIKNSLTSLEVCNKVGRSKYDNTPTRPFSAMSTASSSISLSPIPDWDPVPSLTNFKRFKHLSLTDEAIGGAPLSSPAFRYSSIRGVLSYLSKVLPRSLESFTHVVWEGTNDGGAPPSDDANNWKSWDRIWAASARQQFPNLKKVEAISYGFNGFNDDRRLVWERK